MFSHATYAYILQIHFLLKQEHGFDWHELDNMIPYERDVYLLLLKDHLERKKEQMEQDRMRNGS